MYTVDDCPRITCRDCKYFKVGIDKDNAESECKRIDHKKVKFSIPTFTPCDYGVWHIICNDFAPKNPEYADLQEWTTFDDYWPIYVKSWLPYENEDIRQYFILNNDAEIRYGVPLHSFIDGSMISDGILHATEKQYMKRDKVSRGVQLYKCVTEPIQGVEIETGRCL